MCFCFCLFVCIEEKKPRSCQPLYCSNGGGGERKEHRTKRKLITGAELKGDNKDPLWVEIQGELLLRVWLEACQAHEVASAGVIGRKSVPITNLEFNNVGTLHVDDEAFVPNRPLGTGDDLQRE